MQPLAHSGLSQTSLNGGSCSAPGGGDIHSILANMQRTSARGPQYRGSPQPSPRLPTVSCVSAPVSRTRVKAFTKRALFWPCHDPAACFSAHRLCVLPDAQTH